MTRRFLDLQDLLRLLRREVGRAGGQSAWARRTGVNRTDLNKVLRGSRTPSAQLLKALELQAIVVCAGPKGLELLPIVRQAVLQAGGISAWSRHAGIDRTVVSMVIHGKRTPTSRFFRALKQKRVVAYVALESKAEE
jgi:DNA-binding phage protein